MISVIPVDEVIVINGVGVFGKEVKTLFPSNIHALQFDENKGEGEFEYTDATINKSITAEDIDVDAILKMHKSLGPSGE